MSKGQAWFIAILFTNCVNKRQKRCVNGLIPVLPRTAFRVYMGLDLKASQDAMNVIIKHCTP